MNDNPQEQAVNDPLAQHSMPSDKFFAEAKPPWEGRTEVTDPDAMPPLRPELGVREQMVGAIMAALSPHIPSGCVLNEKMEQDAVDWAKQAARAAVILADAALEEMRVRPRGRAAPLSKVEKQQMEALMARAAAAQGE